MDAKWLRNSFFYFIVLVFLIAFLVAIFNRGGSSNPNDLSALMAAAKADARGGHQDVLVQDGQNLTLTNRPPGGLDIHASLGPNDTLSQYLALYHAFENFMFKLPLVHLERQHGGSMFSIQESDESTRRTDC